MQNAKNGLFFLIFTLQTALTWFLLVGSITGFIQHKLRNRKETFDIGNMFI
jgi:arginine exporter protein ArgO